MSKWWARVARCVSWSTLDHFVTTPVDESTGFYATRVARLCCPRVTMFTAALVSRSATKPQLRHRCSRSFKVFLTMFPHLLHVCEVYAGLMATTLRPAFSAFIVRTLRNIDQETSAIDLLRPAFALAPFGRNCPGFSGSGLAFGVAIMFSTCKASTAMTPNLFTSLRAV